MNELLVINVSVSFVVEPSRRRIDLEIHNFLILFNL